MDLKDTYPIEKQEEALETAEKVIEQSKSHSPPSILILQEKANRLINEDNRIGFPNSKPKYEVFKHGWFFSSHMEVIDLFASALPDTKCIIELGSYLGRSTSYFAFKFPSTIIFAVDLWDNSYLLNDTHYQSSENISILKDTPLYEQFLVNTWEQRYQPEKGSGIVPMRMDTVEALQLLHRFGVVGQVVYVDANHHLEGVVRDVQEVRVLFPQAHIMGDDWDYEDVRKAAQKVAKEQGLRIHVVGGKVWSYSASLLTEQSKITNQKLEAEEEEQKKKKLRVDTKGMSFQKILALYQKN